MTTSASSEEPPAAYRFGDCLLRPGGGGLLRQGEWIPLSRKPFEVLLYLVSQAPRAVSREELLREVWKETRDVNVVEQCIHELRSRLGDQPRDPTFIQTIHGAGYRFLPAVERVDAAALQPVAPSSAGEAEAQAAERRRSPINRPIWLALAVVALAAGWLVFWRRHELSPDGARQPVRIFLTSRELTAVDPSGLTLWRYTLPSAAVGLAPEEMKRRVWFLGPENSAGTGRIVVAVPWQGRAAGAFAHQLFCFADSGRLLWQYVPQARLEFSSRSFDGGWEIVKVVPSGDSLWVAVKHEIWWPAFLVRLRAGRQETVFVNSGAIADLLVVEQGGGARVAVAGINNEFGAAVAVLDPPFEPAVSPQPEGSPYRCRNCAGAAARWYAVLPRTDVQEAGNRPYGVASAVRLLGSSLEVEVAEMDEMEAFYQFDRGELRPTGFAVSDVYPALHDRLFRQGRLNHPAAECPGLIGSRVVRIYRNGVWTDFAVRRVSDSRPGPASPAAGRRPD